MNHLLRFCIFSITVLSLNAHADKIGRDYKYPIENPYFATLASQLNELGKYTYSSAELVLRPERAHIPNEPRYKFEYTFNLQKPDAPVVFVVAGLGGSATSGTSLMLAKMMAAQGYSTVTVPNAFNWQFVLSASRTGLVGYAPTDARDLYDAMKAIRADLVRNHGVTATRFAVMGYSMGGLETGFLLALDRQEKYFNFERAVMINPPLHIRRSIAALDKMYARAMSLSQERRDWDYGYVYNFIDQATNLFRQGKSPGEVLTQFKLREIDAVWLIADSFRQSLREVILASQEIHDLGILKTPPEFMNAREAEAEATTFDDYINKYFYPNLQNGMTVEQTYESGSLTALFDEFQNDPAAYILHNADDFLFESDLNDVLTAKMGDRFTLFPHGGHIGNLWFEENQRVISKIMAGL